MAADGQNLDGVRLYQQGNFDLALQRFQQALETYPDSPDAYYNLARTMHSKATATRDPEAYDQAETLYNQCLDVSENHVECYRALAVMLVETGRSDRAFKLIENWARKNTTSAEPRVELARLYEEFGDTETAKVHLNEALEIDPHDHRAWVALGRIRDDEGEVEQALANYQRALQLNPLQPNVASRIASLNRARHDIAITAPGGTRTVSTAIRY
jgi:Tfp pilus assembly protein PilF